jgi:hypothetical protein
MRPSVSIVSRVLHGYMQETFQLQEINSGPGNEVAVDRHTARSKELRREI